MKQKKLSKKLVLTKETISDLNQKEMEHALGGVLTRVITCTCPFTENLTACMTDCPGVACI